MVEHQDVTNSLLFGRLAVTAVLIINAIVETDGREMISNKTDLALKQLESRRTDVVFCLDRIELIETCMYQI
jgi:hypothetical protein